MSLVIPHMSNTVRSSACNDQYGDEILPFPDGDPGEDAIPTIEGA